MSHANRGERGCSCPLCEVAAKPRREEADRSVRAPLDGLGLLVTLLQGTDLNFAGLEGFDGPEGGVGAVEGGHDGDAALHGGGADFDFVFAGGVPEGVLMTRAMSLFFIGSMTLGR